MIPPQFEYYRAQTVDDAVGALRSGGEDAKILAGGMSLIPVLKMRMSSPPLLVDIGALTALSYIHVDADEVRIGALTRHRDLMTSDLLRDALPMLADVAYDVGDAQVRARGTIGGVLAHADSAGDYCMVALLLDAHIVTTERVIAARDFFEGFMETNLRPDELVTEVRFPIERGPHIYHKFRRRRSDWAVIGVGVQRLQSDPRTCRIGLTNAGFTVTRAPEAEEVFAAGGTADDIAAAAAEHCSPLADLAGDVEYKKALIAELTKRAITEVGA
jgi:carbon-monoxide dehydrogenase medium subunit